MTNIRQLRQKIKAELAIKDLAPPKEAIFRRVYSMPTEMVERILLFQLAGRHKSEAEAARVLLATALDYFERRQTANQPL